METPPPQGIQLKQIVDVTMRRKILIISCIFLAITAGLVKYLRQTKTYQGTALLSYQQQKINPAQMSPDEQEKIKSIVSTLSEIVTSRTNLEKIINSEHLYTDLRESLPIDDVIILMRKNITITPSRDGDTFVVSYEYSEPGKVARVTNAIASGFIEENMKYREEKATETSTYTQDELSMAKNILDKKEAVMRDYKLKYYNEMPEQRTINMTTLASLQTQYQSRQESIQELERTKVLIRDQISVRKQILNTPNLLGNSESANQSQQTIETDAMRLARLEKTLETQQERYTDKHPMIKSLKRKIASLKQKIQNTAQETPFDSGITSESPYDTNLLELQAEIKGIILSIEKINKEKQEINKRIKQYEQWIGATPIREAEWSALTREYGELKRHYDFLVSQNLQADSALNLEKKQKGSQFKIVDAARTPTKPLSPDFVKILKIVLLAGTGLGGGLALGMEMLDTSFRDPKKLSDSFGLEIMCTLPHLTLQKERSKERIIATLEVLFFFIWGSLLIALTYYYWLKGIIVI